jgi:hypothetical protein
MRPLTIALAFALGAVLSLRPAAADQAPPVPLEAGLASARFQLSLAVAEVDACCAGILEEADWDAERRWAQALYRHAVLSAGKADFAALPSRARLAAQALRLDPAYVAALAVHPRSWLEAYWDHLPRAAPPRPLVASIEEFSEALLALGVFEHEQERHLEERNARVADADREFAREADETLAESERVRRTLATLAAAGRPIDLDALFAARRAELDRAIAEREAKIRAIQAEALALQGKWRARIGGSDEGALGLYRDLGKYRAQVEAYDARIQALRGEVETLERQRERYGQGPRPEDLDRLDRPPVTRPVVE